MCECTRPVVDDRGTMDSLDSVEGSRSLDLLEHAGSDLPDVVLAVRSRNAERPCDRTDGKRGSSFAHVHEGVDRDLDIAEATVEGKKDFLPRSASTENPGGLDLALPQNVRGSELVTHLAVQRNGLASHLEEVLGAVHDSPLERLQVRGQIAPRTVRHRDEDEPTRAELQLLRLDDRGARHERGRRRLGRRNDLRLFRALHDHRPARLLCRELRDANSGCSSGRRILLRLVAFLLEAEYVGLLPSRLLARVVFPGRGPIGTGLRISRS